LAYTGKRISSKSVNKSVPYALGQFLLGALRAQDIGAVGDEALAHERALAHGADEAVVVPVAVLERDEASAADASDGLGAGRAALGKQLAKAVGAVGLVVAGGEALARERRVAVGAREALAVPRLVLVGHASAGDDLIAFDAAGGELLLVAAGAVDLLLPRDEGLGADGRLAYHAAEALLVPLPPLVLHLLVAGAEDLAAAVAARRELRVVAAAAVDAVLLRAELLVHQRHLAFVAEEALLMPVLILVRQVLGVNADDGVAVVAGVGEDALVALGAVGVVVLEHIALAREALVALPAAEVLAVPLLRHRLRVLPADAPPLPPLGRLLHD